jgi:phage I-like protein
VKRKKATDIRALVALELAADGAPPTEFRIFSYGQNPSDKGTFIFDEKAAKLVMAAFSKKGMALTMDYEHQALNAPDNGAPAPNSCYSWTPEVRKNDAGKPELWATNAKWTEKAAAHIKAREYLYFSPAFETEPDTMRVARILNMALTNIPALDKQEPLVAASQGDGPMKKMLCIACSTALRAPSDDSDGDEVACSTCLSAAKAASKMTALTAVVGLKAGADADAITSEVRSLSSFRAGVIATLGVDSFDKAMGEIVALKARAAQVEVLTKQIEDDKVKALSAELDGILEAAGKTGKIPPAELQKTVQPILALSGGKPTKENIAVIKDVVSKLVPVITTQDDGGKKPNAEGAGGAYALTSADLEIAKLTGVAPNDIVEHQKKVGAGSYKGMEKPLKFIIQT